ncbi:hypothetical protein BJ508DRAFT_9909 [Ascobolus immersus RN42]|uniref:Uncharacterized protein n=1 Tax=Ascobolus immersus RN42 TaxID=1160509 RepID=A0A3N4HSK6_ASCIM|nr:hypothetical protein BJ508DRAFT_9909 [Ascobolus immersus RN42]
MDSNTGGASASADSAIDYISLLYEYVETLDHYQHYILRSKYKELTNPSYRRTCDDQPDGSTVTPPDVPAICQINAQLLLFFHRELLHYLRSTGGEQRRRIDTILLEGSWYIPNIVTIEIVNSWLSKRWMAGLLRSEQVELVVIVYTSLIRKVRWLMAACEDIQEITEVVISARRVLQKLVFHENLRSERTESLLLRHLANQDVNTEVIQGIENATRALRLGHMVKVINGASVPFDFLSWRALYPASDWSTD